MNQRTASQLRSISKFHTHQPFESRQNYGQTIDGKRRARYKMLDQTILIIPDQTALSHSPHDNYKYKLSRTAQIKLPREVSTNLGEPQSYLGTATILIIDLNPPRNLF